MQLYTNEFTAELKAEIDRSPFTYEELAAMPEDSRAIIAERRQRQSDTARLAYAAGQR